MNVPRYRAAEKVLWDTVGCTPAECFVQLRETGTAVRVQEVGYGPPVLLLHGGPNAGSTWAPLVAHLPGFRCLLVDRPGTGLSEPFPIRADNLESFGAAFVGDLLNGLEVDRAHVVASSFGGHIALRSAAATPERIKRMVQLACPALSPGERTLAFQKLLAWRIFRTIMTALPPNPAANRAILRQLGHGKSLDTGRLPQHFLDWYVELQRHTDTNRNDGEMIANAVRERERLTLTDEILAAVRSPTLLLWGEDETFAGLEVAHYLVDRIPDARMEVIPAAGHLPWLDDPMGAARRITAFLRGAELHAGDSGVEAGGHSTNA
jgi:2-hydroxy-6-oxonona-2,4-dienedioate hydrolase